MATNHPSRKLSKLDEQDMRDSAGELGTNSWGMYSSGPLHMDEQRQDDQLEPTYSSSLRVRDVILKTCWKQWTIGRDSERWLGISMLIARHDDDDIQLQLEIVTYNYNLRPLHTITIWDHYIQLLFETVKYNYDLRPLDTITIRDRYIQLQFETVTYNYYLRPLNTITIWDR